MKSIFHKWATLGHYFSPFFFFLLPSFVICSLFLFWQLSKSLLFIFFSLVLTPSHVGVIFKLLNSDRFNWRSTYKADDTFQKSIAVFRLWRSLESSTMDFFPEEKKQSFPNNYRSPIPNQTVQPRWQRCTDVTAREGEDADTRAARQRGHSWNQQYSMKVSVDQVQTGVDMETYKCMWVQI